MTPWVMALSDGVSTAVTVAASGADVAEVGEGESPVDWVSGVVITTQTAAPGAREGGASPGLMSTATTAWPAGGGRLPRSAAMRGAPAGRAPDHGRLLAGGDEGDSAGARGDGGEPQIRGGDDAPDVDGVGEHQDLVLLTDLGEDGAEAQRAGHH
jgi:hypothetical protein